MEHAMKFLWLLKQKNISYSPNCYCRTTTKLARPSSLQRNGNFRRKNSPWNVRMGTGSHLWNVWIYLRTPFDDGFFRIQPRLPICPLFKVRRGLSSPERSVNFRMSFSCLKFSKKPTKKLDKFLPKNLENYQIIRWSHFNVFNTLNK